MQSSNILCLLIAVAACIGAVAHSFHVSNTQKSSATSQSQLAILTDELSQLRDENISLRERATIQADDSISPSIIELVEQELQLKFEQAPSFHRDNSDALSKAAISEWEAYFGKEGLEVRSHTYQLIGLIPQGKSIIDSLEIDIAYYSKAVYDPTREIVLLSHDFDKDQPEDLAGVVHALSIALIEQHYPAEKELTDDAWIARRSIVRAISEKTRQAFLSQVVGRSSTSEKSQLFDATSEEQRPNYHLLTQALETFTAAQFIEANKAETLKQTLEICLKKAASTKVLFTNEPDSTLPKKTEKNSYLSTSLGYLAVSIICLGSDDLHTIARQLHYDDLSVVESSSGVFTTQWELEFVDEQAATKFKKLYSSKLGDSPHSLRLSSDKKRVLFSITEKPLAE